MHDPADTIAAIASAPGGALRGIVRWSGPGALVCLEKLLADEQERARLGEQRVAQARSVELQLPEPWGRVAAQAYVWPGARSYTREPLVEVHTFGSPPLVEALLAAVSQAGARLARPGEFTLRAFLAGRIDLTQAEAVLGVIDARSKSEMDVALAQLAGGLARPLHELREQLLDLLAHVEAGLDFVDEDIEFIAPKELVQQLEAIRERIRQLAEQMRERAESTAEVRVVLRGWPNVGKSSLLNALAGEPVAIVSEVAGTTRDYVVHRMQIDKLPVTLIDTAGVEPEAVLGSIAAAAQTMTAGQQSTAHLELFCVDATRPLNAWEQQELAQQIPSRIVVLTKCEETRRTDHTGRAITTSARTREGLDELRQAIAQRVLDTSDEPVGAVAATVARCRESLREAAAAVDRGALLAREAVGEELVAAELHLALDELGRVLGAVYTDDILDRIFSRFCIGK